MADDLVVREWDCSGWRTVEVPCITIYEPRAYLSLDKAINEHNALKRAYLELIKSLILAQRRINELVATRESDDGR